MPFAAGIPLLEGREEEFFFVLVVYGHERAPARAVGEEVGDEGGRGRGDVGGLEVDGVEAADEGVVD